LGPVAACPFLAFTLFPPHPPMFRPPLVSHHFVVALLFHLAWLLTAVGSWCWGSGYRDPPHEQILMVVVGVLFGFPHHSPHCPLSPAPLFHCHSSPLILLWFPLMFSICHANSLKLVPKKFVSQMKMNEKRKKKHTCGPRDIDNCLLGHLFLPLVMCCLPVISHCAMVCSISLLLLLIIVLVVFSVIVPVSLSSHCCNVVPSCVFCHCCQ